MGEQEFKGKAASSFHRGVVDQVVCPPDQDFYCTCSRDSTLRCCCMRTWKGARRLGCVQMRVHGTLAAKQMEGRALPKPLVLAARTCGKAAAKPAVHG